MSDGTHEHERLLLELLRSVFGELDPSAQGLLREHLHEVALAGGQTLMAEGEIGDSMYLLVSGRLRAYLRQDDGTQRMVREMARGAIVGEMSLLTDEPRSASVVAIRDSSLVRLDKVQFQRLVAASAPVAVALARQIIGRLRTEHQPSVHAPPVTVGLLPVTAGRVDAPAFAQALAQHLQRFGRVRVIDATWMAQVGQGAQDDAQAHRRIALELDRIEAAHQFVLLVGEAQPTPWTHLCTRHADELLLLADAQEPPVVSAVEQRCLVERPPRAEAAEILLLLHDEATRCPRETARWLARRAVADHVHLRPALERDMARLARLVARQALGLVLAGGGARGFAHLGVIQALQERGIEIDCVGGTSMGAVMSVLAASDQAAARMIEATRIAFGRSPTGDLNPFPFISVIRGARLRANLRAGLQSLFGGAVDLEDLWKNCFVVASNYSQAREEVLRDGSAHQAILASTAIPGALPPVVRDGDLLCDGATFNNFPVDVMRARRGIGRVIGVDLSARKPRRIAFDEVPGPLALLRDRLRPRAARRYKMPSLVSYLLNVTILYSQSREAAARRQTDVYLKPPLERVGLLQWNQFDAVARQGLEHAREVLAREFPDSGRAA